MRSNTRDAARRGYLATSRSTITATTDTQKMQTATIRGLSNELIPNVERFQTYGHTSVPMPSDKNGSAEAIVNFIGGSRSHPIISAVDDRRYRQNNLKPGDVSTYHASGANSTFTKDGYQINMGKAKKPMSITSGNGSIYVSNTSSVVQQGKAQVKLTGSKITLTLKDSTITQDGSVTTIKQNDNTMKIDGSSMTANVGNSTWKMVDGTITATVGGTAIVVTEGKISLGGADASIPVMLKSGESSSVFATS